MKIIWKGKLFSPTGIATVNREFCKKLIEEGHEVQTDDIWNDSYKGLDVLNKPINSNSKDIITIHSGYPQMWGEGYGRKIGHFLHEGSRLFPEWVDSINRSGIEKLWVPTKATYNLFKWNGIAVPMDIVPYGIDDKFVPPKEKEESDEFIFLSVNSWTGEEGDRKGTDLLIKAFNEEFKEDEKVKLILKISTFWDNKDLDFYLNQVLQLTGKVNEKILVNSSYMDEETLVKVFQQADCFVSPTRGEGFGLTILQAMGCGLPVIVTKDSNSGHMDFCKTVNSVLWIDAPTVKQGDKRFFCEGNMFAEPDLESLKKQMRYAFEHKKELNTKATINSKKIIKEWSWDKATDKLISFIEGKKK